MLLLIDNYDSFTYNLSRYFVELGQQVCVVRNDAIDVQEIRACSPSYLVISPGPCTPDQAGVSLAAIEAFAGTLPILGVCLGHQAIGQVFGMQVVRADNIKHGKTSAVHHSGSALFRDVSNPFTATRYHSLLLDADTLVDEFSVTAWTTESESQEIMAIEHHTWPLMGVQFHPESMLTEHGHKVLHNFLKISDNS